MKIGIVSDLHRTLPFFVEQAFDGCDCIICAGDCETESLLWQLQTIAPVINVRGNNDFFSAPLSATCTLDSIVFFVVHRPQDIGVPAASVQVVVHGHTHIPRNEVINGVHYLNPGSPVYPRGGAAPSCMVIETANGSITKVDLVEAPASLTDTLS